jgi:hypothetical protein
MKVTISLTIDEDTDIAKTLRRLTITGEKNSRGLQRILSRYNQLMERTSNCPPSILKDMFLAIEGSRLKVMGSLNYPPKEEFIKLIRASAVNEDVRNRLERFLENITFMEYAKMIEALESGSIV